MGGGAGRGRAAPGGLRVALRPAAPTGRSRSGLPGCTSRWVAKYHGYQFVCGASTVIVECADATWRRLGLDTETTDNAAAPEMLGGVFRRHLDGAPLLDRRPGQHPARWSHFPTLTNERWYDGRVVLLGDAAHIAHYSIGSGTRLALEDAIALGDALDAAGQDVVRVPALRRPTAARGRALSAGGGSERGVV